MIAQDNSSSDQPSRAALLSGRLARLPFGLIAGILLLAASLALLVGGWRQATAFDSRPELVDFFPPERNAGGEYRFAPPRASLFWARPLPAAARITLRVQSPPPLPARELVLTQRGAELLRVELGAAPRTLRILLPPGDPAVPGYALDLATARANAPDDPRALGLLYTTLALEAPPQASPFAAYTLALGLLVAAAALTASLGLGWPVAGLLAFALALVFRADVGRFWLYAGWACAALAAVRLVAPLPVRDWAERQRAWSPPAWAAAGVAALFVAVVGGYALANHRLYGTNGYDLGLYDQTFWLISRGLPNFSTGAGINMVGSHAALVLYPIATLYWLLPDARTALALQTLAVALAAMPLYLLGRERGHPWLGVAAGAAYLAHPATQNMALFDFHVDTIAATGLLFALWAAEARRWRLLLACCALVMLCKENFAITTAWLGLWLIASRQPLIGALIAATSVAWFLVATQLLVPALIGQDSSLHVSRFAQYGDSLPAIALFALTNPLVVLGDLLAPGAGFYLLALLAPFAFLPLLSPYSLLALPALAINLLSAFGGQRELLYHYNSLIVAVFAAATLDALVRVGALGRGRAGGLRSKVAGGFSRLACLLLLIAVLLTQNLVPLRRALVERTAARETQLSLRRDYVLALIPPGAPVAAHSNFQPHLSTRQQAFIYPNPFIAADFYNPKAMPFAPLIAYVVLDTRRVSGGVPVEAQLQLLDELQARGLYRRAADLGGLVLLERLPGAPEGCYGAGWQAEECRR